MVSFSVSPLDELVTLGSVKPMTLAPSRLAAVSKERRVRVEGSKKSVATTLPFRIFLFGCFSKACAISIKYMIFSFERLAIVTKLCFILIWSNGNVAKLGIFFETTTTFSKFLFTQIIMFIALEFFSPKSLRNSNKCLPLQY